jgi:hypothetical protein
VQFALAAPSNPQAPFFLPQPRSVATIEGVLSASKQSRLFLILALVSAGYWAAACTAAFGPGYTIEKQEIRVQFVGDPQPGVRVEADYRLRNTGNQPLSLLELRLPGRRLFHFADPRAEWDGQAVTFEPSAANPRNVQFAFPQSWTISTTHTLHLSVEFQPAEAAGGLSFAPDAFYLPAEGWSPLLLPARGIFATGGVPPKSWLLTLRVPDGFLVHASGRQSKASRAGGEQVIRSVQRSKDGYPFIIAGRFRATRLSAGPETINLWTRAQEEVADFRQTADSLVKSVAAYNAMFGNRSEESHQLWVVECPTAAGCFTGTASNYSKLISQDSGSLSAQMASLDSVVVDLSGDAKEIAAAAGPALASSWLGYGQNPGFFEQDPPLSALPAFAASRGREAVQGPEVRSETIRRALSLVPVHGEPKKPEDEAVIRAKSLLFFYGLQDRYGQDTFNKAISHMLYARRRGGFDLDDLIASFEQETHQNVAELVRRWMKRPGVPDDFRARYQNAGVVATAAKETIP